MTGRAHIDVRHRLTSCHPWTYNFNVQRGRVLAWRITAETYNAPKFSMFFTGRCYRELQFKFLSIKSASHSWARDRVTLNIIPPLVGTRTPTAFGHRDELTRAFSRHTAVTENNEIQIDVPLFVDTLSP